MRRETLRWKENLLLLLLLQLFEENEGNEVIRCYLKYPLSASNPSGDVKKHFDSPPDDSTLEEFTRALRERIEVCLSSLRKKLESQLFYFHALLVRERSASPGNQNITKHDVFYAKNTKKMAFRMMERRKTLTYFDFINVIL